METKTNSRSGRRELDDRRRRGDRRRNADIRTPIIHIGHSMLRVAVIVERAGGQGSLAITESVPWRIDAESLHSEQGIAELRAALATLAANQRLAGTRARVLLNSDLCVTRAVTGAAEEVQRETTQLRERSQLYLSLGPGQKVIASSSTPLDARHAHTLLTIATGQTLSIVSDAIEASGMRLDAIESAQVSVARVVGAASKTSHDATIVVHVDEGEIELGVVSRGRLFLDYRPGGNVHADQLDELLRQHYTRLRRYCQRHHGLDGTKLSRVIVSGAASEAQKSVASVRPFGDVEVELLDLSSLALPWELRGEGLGPEMAGVIGAAIGLADEGTTRSPNLVNQLNNKARPPVTRMLLRKLAPLAAVVVAGIAFGLLNWHTNRQVDLMRADLAMHAPQAARANELRLGLLAADGELRQLSALCGQLAPQPVSVLLKNLTESIPPEVWLSGLRIEAATSATMAGSSYLESSIYDLVGHLQNVPGIADVALQGTGVGRTAHGNATSFDIHFEVLMAEPGREKGASL